MAQAQSLDSARIVEWDCPLMGQEATTPPPDPEPGALVYQDGFAWFVTRAVPRLVRFQPGGTTQALRETAIATCNWWELDPLTVTTGGLRFRPVPLSNTAFVRGVSDIQRVITGGVNPNVRTRWVDGLFSLSDVSARAVNGTNHVFTTGATGAPPPDVIPDVDCAVDPITCAQLGGPNVLQRLSVNGGTAATITRWPVGGGAGSIQYSGVAVHPTLPNLVYYSEPASHNIGELNTTPNPDGTYTVRRWNLEAVGVITPKQLDLDAAGMVWVVTQGHLVRIDPLLPVQNVLTALIPTGLTGFPTGIDVNGNIGFTVAAGGTDAVGFLQPNVTVLATVPPMSENVRALLVNGPLPATSSGPTPQLTGPAKPVVKTSAAVETPDPNGTFVETLTAAAVEENPADCNPPAPFNNAANYPTPPCAPSLQPQGIAHDPLALGTYYTAIGMSTLRIAHVTLPAASLGSLTANGLTALTDPITGQQTGTGSFSLTAYRTAVGQPAKGTLTYKAPAGDVSSLQITDLTFAGNTATVEGLCRPGTGCSTFKLSLTDGGWSPSSDEFKVMRNPLAGIGLVEGGKLRSGSVKIWHR